MGLELPIGQEIEILVLGESCTMNCFVVSRQDWSVQGVAVSAVHTAGRRGEVKIRLLEHSDPQRLTPSTQQM
jgi:hypothetical protein